jgi:glucokinase
MDDLNMKEYCVGIDVGGTKLSAALFSPEGKMSSRSKSSIDTSHPDKINSQIVEIVKNLESIVEKIGAKIEAVGIAIPGIVYQTSGKVWAPNIPGWEHYPLKDHLLSEIAIPITLDSDRSAYVLNRRRDHCEWTPLSRE